MQAAFGLDQPDYGYLLASIFAYEGTTLARERLHRAVRRTRAGLHPSRLACAVPTSPSPTSSTAIDYAIPAIEIIDSRVQDWAIGLPDTLADNGSTGSVILGGTPRRITDLTLRDTRGALRFNGREVITGNTGNILGNPLAAVAWLCNRLADYDVEFTPGQVILPGSCLQAVPMNQAGRLVRHFRGLGNNRIRGFLASE